MLALCSLTFSYLEIKDKVGESPEYRPWLWIVWLFVGPTISSISFDWYIFVAVWFPHQTLYAKTNILLDQTSCSV